MVAVCLLSEASPEKTRFLPECTHPTISKKPEKRVPQLDLDIVPNVRIATQQNDLVAAYRLVFQRYCDSGYIQNHRQGIIYSPVFAHGDSRTLVALSAEGRVAATATLGGAPSCLGSSTDGAVI